MQRKEVVAELYAQLDAYIESLHITDDNPRRKEMLIQTLRKAQGATSAICQKKYRSMLPIGITFHMPKFRG